MAEKKATRYSRRRSRRPLAGSSAECDARNERSAKLLARLGFRQEGHRVEHTWIKGEWTDDLLFGLLAKDFETP